MKFLRLGVSPVLSRKMCSRISARFLPQLFEHFHKTNITNVKTLTFFCTRGGICTTPSLVKTVQRRHFIEDASKKEIFGEDRIRVYYGMLTPQIRTVKWFSLTTSIIGLTAQPFIFKELSALNNLPLLLAGCSFVGFFTFMTPFLLHFVTKKYVTHLDYNTKKDTYIAHTVNFFCMLRETEFKTTDVKVPDVPGMFTTFLAKGKPLFLEARAFEDPSHYIKIMGYDKPMDFKITVPQTAPEEGKDKK